MEIAAGNRVVVAVGRTAVMVFVTAANLASHFTGRPYNPEASQWEPPENFTYEQVVGVVKKRSN